MTRRISDRGEHKLMDDDPLEFIMWLTGYKLKNYLYVIKSVIFIVVSYLQIFNIICIIDIILYKNFTYLKYLPSVFMQQPGCFGLIIVFAYIKDLFQYQENVFSNFWSISSGGKKTKNRILRESKIVKLMCIIIYGICILAHLSFIPIVGDEKRFIFPVMYCAEYFGRWSRIFILIFYINLLLIPYGVVCPLFGAIYIIFHAKFQIYFLDVNIRKIPKQDSEEENRLNSELRRQRTIYERLSVCARHHAIIKMVANTTIREAQNLTMLTYFVVGLLAFISAYCFIIFDLSPSSNWRMILVLTLSISLSLAFCICGQKFTDESNQFFVTLCNAPWYHWNRRNNMALGMMLMNSREPLKVSCYGLIDLNYALILLAVRITYSLLALSRKFK